MNLIWGCFPFGGMRNACFGSSQETVHCPISITHVNERERNAVLVSLVGDPKQDVKHIDPVTKLISELLNVSACMADFIYNDKAYLISRYNWAFSEIPRHISFCGWSLLPLNPEPLIVEDTLQDARFRESDYVQQIPCLRFYVGVPIVVGNGTRLGNLCVMDVVPTLMSADSIAFMCNCATLITSNILYESCKKTSCHQSNSLIICDVSCWNVLYANQSCADFGVGLAVGDNILSKYKEIGGSKVSCLNTFEDTFEMTCVHKYSAKPILIKFWKCSLKRFPHLISVMPNRNTPIKLRNVYFAEIFDFPVSISSSSLSLVAPLSDVALKQKTQHIELHELLGIGEHGCTYKITFKGTKKALKMLNNITESIHENDIVRLSKLRHSNINMIHECIQCNTTLWIVMDLCNNDTLQANIDRGYFRRSFYNGHVDFMKTCQVALQIAKGIKFLHENNVVHGNLTSKNIMHFEKDIFKVSDFSLTLPVQKQVLANLLSDVIYKPLEYLTYGELNFAVDTFAFGIIMYELYTNQRPWAGTYPSTVMTRRICGDKLCFPYHTPSPYKKLAMKCMHDNPHKRPQMIEIVNNIALIIKNLPQVTLSSPVYDLDDFH